MKVEALRFYLISTEIGTISVRREILSDYDVDAVVRNRAMSQARTIQMVNTGNQIDGNTNLPSASLPSVYRSTDDQLIES